MLIWNIAIYDPKKRQYKCRSIPSTDWNDGGKADEWRKAWEDAANATLKRYGFDGRIDRRSYAEQGIIQVPTIHLGPAASQMEKRGIRTGRGDMNREIEITNKQIRQLRARIGKLDKWIAEESLNDSPPTLSDVLTEILQSRGQSAVSRLKSASQMLIFLQHNEIYSMGDLEKKVSAMQSKVYSMGDDLKKVNRRIDTLKEHLMHSDNFKKHRKVKAMYDKLYAEYRALKKGKGFFAERKAQKALAAANDYYETHRPQLAMFENAEKYLREVLQGRYDPKKLPPITKWREELATLTIGKDGLYQDYKSLKAETQKVEQIKRSVADILHGDSPEWIPQQSQEWSSKKSYGAEL